MSISPVRRMPLRFAAALFTIAALLVIPNLASRFDRRLGRPDQRIALLGDTGRLPRRGDDGIAALQQRVRDNPQAFMPYISLAQAYLQKIRETGDPALYGKTQQLLDRAAQIDPQNAELFATRGTLALGRHDFAGALVLGRQALALNPASAPYYGVVADAQIELGMYDAAIKMLQQMVDHRPDFNSYSRIAYARELYGDTEGAAEAMQRAIVAGSAIPEHGAWAYVQLGNLAFGSGDLQSAQHDFDLGLRMLDNYPPALAGQARVATAKGDLRAATGLYQRAFNTIPLPEYAIALGDVYAKLGDKQQAQRQYDLVRALDKLFVSNGVNTDLESALFFADHDIDLQASLAKARAAYAARPSIHTADGVAWTLYKTGNYQAAQRYAGEALKLGTHDALKLFHAGMIAKALGQKEQARTRLQAAIDLNPHFSLLYGDLAAATLKELGPAHERSR